MKSSQKFLIIAICLLTVVTLAGCGSPKSQIIGKWKEQTSGAEVEFFKDGTVILKVLLTNIGKYSFVDNDTIRLELSGLLSLAGAQMYDVKIADNVLTLTNGSTVLTFNRVTE
jgi:hypothetical protein